MVTSTWGRTFFGTVLLGKRGRTLFVWRGIEVVKKTKILEKRVKAFIVDYIKEI